MKKLILAVVFSSLVSCVVVTNKTIHNHIRGNSGAVSVEGKNSGSEARDALNGSLNGSLNPDVSLPIVP